MKIISTDLPKYTVTFDHPDTGVEIHTFFAECKEEPSAFDDEEWAEYERELKKAVWDKYNHCGYYHTMTITAEYVIDGKAYNAIICEDIGMGDL